MDTVGSSRRWRPPRAYPGALVALFVVTALASVTLNARLELGNRLNAADDDAAFSASLAAQDLSTALTAFQDSLMRIAAVPTIGPAFGQADCTLAFGTVGPFKTARLDLVRPDGSVLCSSTRGG